jgi:hypothetical protein
MLTELKNAIRQQELTTFVMEETAMRSTDDDVRDLFLDDIDNILDGSEDDPELAKLADEIPEYDDDDITDADIEKLTESLIPEYAV